jgi:hypothetical protein
MDRSTVCVYGARARVGAYVRACAWRVRLFVYMYVCVRAHTRVCVCVCVCGSSLTQKREPRPIVYDSFL